MSDKKKKNDFGLIDLLKLAPEFIKYLPVIMKGFGIVKKMIELGKIIFLTDKETPEQEVEFKQLKDSLVLLIFEQLPLNVRAFTDRAKLDHFTDKLVVAADAAGESVVAFAPLRHPKGPQPKA